MFKRFTQAILTTTLAVASVSYGYDKIVLLSPDVGDIVVALGEADKVVGKDDTNRNKAFGNAKTIGMHRNLTLEPIVALKPDLVIGSYMVLPNSLYGRLNALNITAVNVAPNESKLSYGKSIERVARLLGKSTQGATLANQWRQAMNPRPATKTRYLLSYDGRIVAGKGTVGDELIQLAGGVNAASDVDGLKPLSREGWIGANADVIIVAEHSKSTLGTLEQFKARPEIMANPAGKTNNVYYWPAGDFLSFGLDSPQVIDKLHQLAK